MQQAALAALERGGDAHLDAEFIRLVRLSFADAFDLWRVQAVDLGAALPALLLAPPVAASNRPSFTSATAQSQSLRFDGIPDLNLQENQLRHREFRQNEAPELAVFPLKKFFRFDF